MWGTWGTCLCVCGIWSIHEMWGTWDISVCAVYGVYMTCGVHGDMSVCVWYICAVCFVFLGTTCTLSHHMWS